MSATADPKPDLSANDPRSAFWGTLPLISLTAALFVGAYLGYVIYPHLGPDNLPIWGLLLTLGFVAAIGSVVSWFFGTDEGEAVPERPATTSPAISALGRASRAELGRPVPEVRGPLDLAGPSSGVGLAVVSITGTAAAPWDEDVLPPVAVRGPRPVLTTLDDPGDIGRALEEIAEIQRQLAARALAPMGTRESPARA